MKGLFFQQDIEMCSNFFQVITHPNFKNFSNLNDKTLIQKYHTSVILLLKKTSTVDLNLYNSKIIIMLISLNILLLFASSIVAIYSSSRFELINYTQETAKNNWRSIQTSVAQAEEVIIRFSGLKEHTFNNFLRLPMPKLKVLSFGEYHFDGSHPVYQINKSHQQFLSHKLLKTIFVSSYFDQLEELNLIGTNIDDRFWSFLSEIDWSVRQVQLRKLLLGSNQFGAFGIQQISKIPFDHLTQLDLSGNLLIEPESTNSLLKILSGKDSQSSKKRILSLDLSSTNINGQDLLRILQAIDTKSLISLNISQLNLHQKNKYHQGLDLSFYESFVKMEFPSLRQLAISDLALDSALLKLFRNFKLPSLETLYLQRNFIDDQSVKHWITKVNLPRLKSLVLANTDIKDEGLNFITKQGFDFQELNVGITMLSRNALTHLYQLNTSSLKKLFLKKLGIQSTILKDFLQNNSFQNLQQLSLTDNQLVSLFFSYFPWLKLKKVRMLILSSNYFDNSLGDYFNISQILLPNLKYLMLNGGAFSPESLIKMLSKISVMFPSLDYVDLTPGYITPINFTELSLRSFHKKVQVQLGYVTFELNNHKLSLVQFKRLNFILLYSSKRDLKSYIDPPSQLMIKGIQGKFQKKTMTKEMILLAAKELNELFTIEHLDKIVINSQLQWKVFIEWINQAKIIKFSSLTSFTITDPISVQEASIFLATFKMPMLRNLWLTLNVTKKYEDFDKLLEPLQKLQTLIQLKILFKFPSSFSRQKDYNHFFNKLHYPFLIKLDLSQNHLETEELGGVIYNHSPTLRFLIVNNNFIQKSFLKLISQYQLKLKIIDISYVSFTASQFSILALADMGFILDFKADSCDLTDTHISEFIDNNSNIRTYLFPKLGLLSLNQNQIRQNGTKMLFQQSLYNLVAIRINRNYNPHFLNILLTYTTKINEIIVDGLEIYALDTNIQPISTRRTSIFIVDTQSFSSSDYKILGSLNFNRLQLLKIQTRNLYECEHLHDLLSVTQNARIAYVIFNGERQKLNSSCIDRTSQKYQKYESQVEQLFVAEETDRTFVPVFVQLMFTSKKQITKILLERLRLPPSVFLLLNPKNLQHLKALHISENHIDDQGFKRILQSPLQKIQTLRVKDTDITMKSLSFLAHRTFDVLQHLDLSGLPLGQEGIDVLLTLNARKLKLLVLERCDIRSLKKFTQMSFPMVYELFISYNYLDIQQIITFLKIINKQNWPYLTKITALGYSPSVTEWQQISSIISLKKIQLKFDKPHYYQVVNSAKY